MTQPAPPAIDGAAPRPGRKRDHSRDPEILRAAIDVLAEEGFDGMTIDMVATRAKAGKATLYRRWPSKAELVLDAIGCMKSADLSPDRLPDTGTLRGDLIGMITPRTAEDAERRMRVMAGVAALLSREPELTEAASAVLMSPRIVAIRGLLERALARGEIRADADLDMLARLLPALAAFRGIVERKPIDREYQIALIDGILLPAAGVARSDA
ncbi:MAG: TetR/AcrR family transcriptional regulator [Microbacterium sp.]|uniref:TetR/AcrR family transcriptional regulator n=1 Tax=Microbacterium sp. TaxID=51671 RepID=UPI0027210190|nr:TetR/AcrR family transcriptional regulator [Microbacterium sp.]MDO8382871.1 TetR/AcrR family transcriptional regulator [Microbacterium sp.]